MAPKEPKSKDTDKIQFFKIGQEGEISPLFPRPNEPIPDDKDGKTGNVSTESFPPEPLGVNYSIPEFPEQTSSVPKEQIHTLKNQVGDLGLNNEGQLWRTEFDILKKYASLKEGEVQDLKDQQRQYQSYLQKLSSQQDGLSQNNRELLLEVESLKKQEGAYRLEVRALKQKHKEELLSIKQEYEDRVNRSASETLDSRDLSKKREEWKEKVKEDLKRIKLKERELENKYELLKRDTQALLDSKDQHLLELKKKNDASELEIESMEDQLRRGTIVQSNIESKKKRLIETMKLAISLLEEIDTIDVNEDEERKVG